MSPFPFLCLSGDEHGCILRQARQKPLTSGVLFLNADLVVAALIAACALRLSSERYRFWIRLVLSLFAVFYALCTAIDTSLFSMTGSQIDLENLRCLRKNFWLIWPVISSEMGVARGFLNHIVLVLTPAFTFSNQNRLDNNATDLSLIYCNGGFVLQIHQTACKATLWNRI